MKKKKVKSRVSRGMPEFLMQRWRRGSKTEKRKRMQEWR